MSGGSNKIVKVVSAEDCEAAKNELLNTKTDDAKNQLNGQLVTAGLTPIPDTFNAAPGAVGCTPAVGQEATEATAGGQFNYSMLGAQTAAVEALIKEEAKDQLQGSDEILDTGLLKANITVKDRKTNGDIVVAVSSEVTVGVKQDAEAIAQSVAGKKKGQSYDTLRSLPGVKEVTINYSPFWVSKTPKNTSKITVTFTNQDGGSN
jgi:hypothetical protein